MQHGDVIVTTCTGLPLCVHPAIVLEECGELWVYNNTPSAKNGYGGNVVRQRPAEFFKGRKLLEVRPMGLDGDHVREMAYALRFEKWNALGFNCEDFVSEVVTCERRSQLREVWVMSGVAVLALLL